MFSKISHTFGKNVIFNTLFLIKIVVKQSHQGQ